MAYKGFDLDGRTAVVVGGTTGIGHRIACGLAQAGADVIPTGRHSETVNSDAKDIEALGRRTLRICSDVWDRASLETLLDTFLMRAPMGRFGQLEELVGSAVFLFSDAASFVIGTVLRVDGGLLASGVNQ